MENRNMKTTSCQSDSPKMSERERMAEVVKKLHRKLRDDASEIGAALAWQRHVGSSSERQIYAEAMRKLAASWKTEATEKATCRLVWIASNILEYFTEGILAARRRESTAAAHNGIQLADLPVDEWGILRTLDAGSCYNPFAEYQFMDVLPVDLTPAVDGVLRCDFANVTIANDEILSESEVVQFKRRSFDAVIFSLMLEYLPTSAMRLKCCKNAYELLKSEGILAIVTPDSKHVGANAKIYKNWRYALARIGFMRIKYEKLQYLHCMIFRKSIDPRIPQIWADEHREPYMTDDVHIPQDFPRIDPNAANVAVDHDPVMIVNMFQQLPEAFAL